MKSRVWRPVHKKEPATVPAYSVECGDGKVASATYGTVPTATFESVPLTVSTPEVTPSPTPSMPDTCSHLRIGPAEHAAETSDGASSTDADNASSIDGALESLSETSGPASCLTFYTKEALLRARPPFLHEDSEREGGRFFLKACRVEEPAPSPAGKPSPSPSPPTPPPSPPAAPQPPQQALRASPPASLGGEGFPCEPPSSPTLPEPESAPRLPPASPNSWALMQRQRRQKEKELEEAMAAGAAELPSTPSSDDLVRRVKSILNKLTPEKFNTLYIKLMQCGIDETAHMEMLARVICEEAVLQCNFSSMYADLCMYMLGDLSQEGGKVFAEAVLESCTKLFDQSLDRAGEDAAALGDGERGPRSEDEEEAQATRKRRTIGNVRFIGELLIRDVFPPQVLFTCTDRLVKPRCGHRLEMLATLLTVVGPVFDTMMWPRHSDLVPMFWLVRGLTCDASVPKRVRCLLRDVAELRDAMWVDASSGKKNEKPMTLGEVRNGANHQASAAQFGAWVALTDFCAQPPFLLPWGFADCAAFMPDFADVAAAEMFASGMMQEYESGLMFPKAHPAATHHCLAAGAAGA